MNTLTDSRDGQNSKVLVRCAVCALEVPLDEAVVPEVTDRLVYLCGLDCYSHWRDTAATSFPALLPEPRS